MRKGGCFSENKAAIIGRDWTSLEKHDKIGSWTCRQRHGLDLATHLLKIGIFRRTLSTVGHARCPSLRGLLSGVPYVIHTPGNSGIVHASDLNFGEDLPAWTQARAV
eukprot:3404106-Rhodomonas_salina.1